jgi:hypothetical protein
MLHVFSEFTARSESVPGALLMFVGCVGGQFTANKIVYKSVQNRAEKPAFQRV